MLELHFPFAARDVQHRGRYHCGRLHFCDMSAVSKWRCGQHSRAADVRFAAGWRSICVEWKRHAARDVVLHLHNHAVVLMKRPVGNVEQENARILVRQVHPFKL